MGNQIEQRLSSREVSQMMDIRHDHLLVKIDKINEDLKTQEIGCSKYWVESTYKQANGKENREFQITKRGCEFLAHKTTGTKGNLFTDRYMDKFEYMEKQLSSGKHQLDKKPTSALDLFESQLLALKEVKGEVKEVRSEFEEFKEDLPLIGAEPEELQKVVRRVGTSALGGHGSPAYKDKSLSAKVYKNVWKFVKEQFNVNTYKAIKRKHLSKAKEIAENYTLPFYLQEEIELINSQGQLNI